MGICRWYHGKQAALSLRFDDSHVTHIEHAVPLLNERELVGTFMVNPGNPGYREQEEAWRAAVAAGHELANHTMTHAGAPTDREAEWEIGEAARVIREVQPDLRLLAFLRGGATRWLQRKPIEFFMAKYELYDLGGEPSPSSIGLGMSCSEEYAWFSPAAFEDLLARGIERGGWVQPHFHCIGEDYLVISLEGFRAILDAVDARRDDVWCAGISAIHQYERERESSAVFAHAAGDDELIVHLVCATDADLYAQPLTIELELPEGGGKPRVTHVSGDVVESWIETADGKRALRFDAAPADAAYTVRAAGLGRAHRLAGGRMSAPGKHPYLFFSEEDLPGLLEKQSDRVGGAIWTAITEESGRLQKQEPSDVSARARDRALRMRVILFHAALTQDPDAVAAALRHLDALAGDDSWHCENTEMLVTAAAVGTLGLAYDWLYDSLGEERRGVVRRAIIEHGITPTLAATAEREWWTHWPRGNWGEVIYSQVGVAALALLADEPEAADWVRLCHRKVWHYFQAIGRDGGWGESGSYALYAWSNGLMFADALRRVTGADLFAEGALRELPTWFINLLEPNGTYFVPFSDCGPWTQGLPSVLLRVATEYGDGYAQGVAKRHSMDWPHADVWGFLWYDPGVPVSELSDRPRSKLFRDIHWAFLRSEWEDPQATLFALKGGEKDWDHYHHDSNSFVLYAEGRPLLVDLLYPRKLWGLRTEAHNTTMVNGREQRGELRVAGTRGRREHRAVVSDLMDAGWYARVVGDASQAYEPGDVESFVREVLYLRGTDESAPPDYFVVFDDVVVVHPAEVAWLAHTYGEMAVAEGRLTATQDDAAVDVSLIAPQPLTFEMQRKSLEEAGAPRPFESAEALTWTEAKPSGPVPRAYFVAVLAPRAADEAPELAASRVYTEALLGAVIECGSTRDVALFALDAPEIEGHGVEAIGRTCFVRRHGGRVTAAAIHGGRRLECDGALLFEADGSGDAAVSFGGRTVEARLALYDSGMVRVHTGAEPGRVLLNGEVTEFEYEPDTECVRVEGRNMRSLSISLD